VMQFRKVCNHPELFERRDIRSPFSLPKLEYNMSRLVHQDQLFNLNKSKAHLVYNKLSVWKADNIHKSLWGESEVLEVPDTFSFLRFVDISPGEAEKITVGGLLEQLLNAVAFEARRKLLNHREEHWGGPGNRFMLLMPQKFNKSAIAGDSVLRNFIFTSRNSRESSVYTFQDIVMASTQETADHRIIRSRHAPPKLLKSPTRAMKSPIKSEESQGHIVLLPEFPHVPREPRTLVCEATEMPRFLYQLPPKIHSSAKRLYVESRVGAWEAKRFDHCDCREGWELIDGAVNQMLPHCGWSAVTIPDKQALVSDAGKLYVLDLLLTRLKSEGHRVLIYSQMTKMIDLLEEYMWHRKHRYMRLDGSSKISARRDMVADFQSREDIFCFLLSTRAGGLGINLTAADTVSSWMF
jgi:chromatin-remodeling ATPase INO80